MFMRYLKSLKKESFIKICHYYIVNHLMEGDDMKDTEKNDIATIDTLKENAFIKELKKKAATNMYKTATSNMDKDRTTMQKLKREKTEKADVEAYYQKMGLTARDILYDYFIKDDEKTLTDLDTLKNKLNNIDTDLTNIDSNKNLNEEVYKIILRITSAEDIAKNMLKKMDTNYDTFKRNAINKIAENKGKSPTEFIEILTSIRDLAITRYNELSVAYTEISESKETADYINKERIKDGLEPTF